LRSVIVEFYVRSAVDPKAVYPLGSTYLGDRDQEYARTKFLSCRVCGRQTADLLALRQPATGWPDVLFVVCDQGKHRVDEP
jgi:hypothetical protein